MKIRSRILSLSLVLAMLVGMSVVPAAAASGYRIEVGGTSFYSSQDKSGSGWSYDSEEGLLTLDNYSGGAIAAAGDLVIYANGDCAISGSDSPYVGQHGIDVAGVLELYVDNDGNLTVYGGDGRTGGCGIQAYEVYIDDFSSDEEVYHELEIHGGNGSSDDGGAGIFAEIAVVYSWNMYCSIYGGRGFYYGGAGVEADYVELYVDAGGYLCGGYGNVWSGSGVRYAEVCDIGFCGELTLRSYDETGYAMSIPTGADAKWYLNDHMSWGYAEDNRGNELTHIRYFWPTEYTITLDGAGGTLSDGQDSCELTGTAMDELDLEGYAFEREGYVLLGFESSYRDILMTSDYYYPFVADETLVAQWAPLDEDTVLFVGGDGFDRFKTGSWYVAKDAGTVTMPEREEFKILYEDDEEQIYEFIGWSTYDTYLPMSQEEYNKVTTAAWYGEGDTAEVPGGTILYGVSAWTGANLIRYEPNGGEIAQGGTYVMRVDEGDDGDFSMAVLGNEDEFTFTREGYAFVGWNTKADGTGKVVKEGEILPYIETTPMNLHTLYAQWVPVAQDDVMFVANGVTFVDGTLYQMRPADGQTVPPVQSEMNLDGRTLVAWSDVDYMPIKVNVADDAYYDNLEGFNEKWEKLMNAAWYTPGEAADIPGGTVLYAAKIPATINVVRYEGNGGLDAKGGNCAMRALGWVDDEGKNLCVLDNGDEFTFTRPGCEFVGWNTEADGSGEWLEAGAELEYIYQPDDPYIHVLYAQWESENYDFVGTGAPGDSVTFNIAPFMGKLTAEISITSVTNPAATEKNVQGYIALYKDGKLIAVETEQLSLNETGITGKLALEYDDKIEPSECRVFLLSTDGTYRPVCQSIGVKF